MHEQEAVCTSHEGHFRENHLVNSELEQPNRLRWFHRLTGTLAHGVEMLGRLIFNLSPGAVACVVAAFRPENPFKKEED